MNHNCKHKPQRAGGESIAEVVTISVNDRFKGIWQTWKAKHPNTSAGIMHLVEREVRENPGKYV